MYVRTKRLPLRLSLVAGKKCVDLLFDKWLSVNHDIHTKGECLSCPIVPALQCIKCIVYLRLKYLALSVTKKERNGLLFCRQ